MSFLYHTEVLEKSKDIFLKDKSLGDKLDCMSSSSIDAHKNVPAGVWHICGWHILKRLKTVTCDEMFHTWWWRLLHCAAYDFLSFPDMLQSQWICVMRSLWKYGLSHILITAIFLYRKQTLIIIINRLGYIQKCVVMCSWPLIKLFFCPDTAYNRLDDKHVWSSHII